jgi:hypothetical protein
MAATVGIGLAFSGLDRTSAARVHSSISIFAVKSDVPQMLVTKYKQDVQL